VSVRPAPLVLLAPLLVAACGSSSSPASPSSTPTQTSTQTSKVTSVAQFVAAANAVCIKSDRRIFKIGRLTRDPSGWAKTAAAARVGVSEMRAVTAPASRAAAFRLMLGYGQRLAQSIQTIHDELAKKHFNAAINAQFAAARLQDHVHSEAKLAGLTFCQQPLTNWPG